MTALIGLDWGVSSLRAWRLAADGAVLETRRAAGGVLSVAPGGFPGAFAAAVGDWTAANPAAPVLLCGMVGSKQGWVEAAYAPAPAGLAELAGALAAATVDGRAVARIVPGVSRIDGARREAMRGEETQIVGAAAMGRRLAVLPGSHSKWAAVEEARILDFATYLTGELFAALKSATILGRGLLAPGPQDAAEADVAFAAGVRAAAEEGLAASLFQTRSRLLLGGLTPQTAESFLSGLVIGAELAAGLARFGRPARPALVVGASGLVARYREAFAVHGLAVEAAGEETAAAGLHAVARAAGLI